MMNPKFNPIDLTLLTYDYKQQFIEEKSDDLTVT